MMVPFSILLAKIFTGKVRDANFTDKEEASCGGFLLVDRFGGAKLAGDSGFARLSNAARESLFRSNQFAGQIAHGVPGCGETYGENCG